MTRATDPCPHWAVFRMIESANNHTSSQISVLRDNDQWRLYCCHTLRTRDMAGNPHVLSVGVDLVPALSSNQADVASIVDGIGEECRRKGGQARIRASARRRDPGNRQHPEHRMDRGVARPAGAHHLPACLALRT